MIAYLLMIMMCCLVFIIIIEPVAASVAVCVVVTNYQLLHLLKITMQWAFIIIQVMIHFWFLISIVVVDEETLALISKTLKGKSVFLLDLMLVLLLISIADLTHTTPTFRGRASCTHFMTITTTSKHEHRFFHI